MRSKDMEPWEIALEDNMVSIRKSTKSIQRSFRIIISIITVICLYEIGTLVYVNMLAS